jgi:general secretion pathway protein I
MRPSTSGDDRRGRRRGGFTLLEVMAALAIIAVVLTAVYRMHAQTISMNATAGFYANAPLLARSVLARLTASPSADRFSDRGDFGENLPGYRWEANIEDISSDILSEVLGETVERLKRIDVTVTLNEDYTFGVRTYRLLPGTE